MAPLSTQPGDDSARYQKIYDVYKDIYPSLRPLFPRLSEALKG